MIFFIIFSLTKHPLKSTLSAAKRKKRKLHGMQCKTTANEFDTISCKKVMQKVLDPQMNYIRSQQTTTDDMHTNSQSSQTLQPTSPQTLFHLHSPQTLSSKTLLFKMGHKLSTFTLTSSKPQTFHSQPHALFSSSPQQCCTRLLWQISLSLQLKQPHKTM